MSYQRLISEIDPTVDAAQVEQWMRDQYRTLCHLPHETFVREVALFKTARAMHPDVDFDALYGPEVR